MPGTAANTNGSGQISGLSNLTNGVTNQCLTVTALTPTLTKAFSPTSISIGGTSTLTFTVSNPALNPAQTVSFTDTLPAGLRVASAPNVTNTCTGGTVTAVALSGSIAVAGTQVGAGTATPTTCTISVDITTSATPTVGACPGTAANTNGSGQISGLSNLTNGVTNQCLTVTALTPTLTKAFSPTSISIGGTSTLTFTVSNPALNPAQTVSFTDTLPAGLRVASAPNVTNTCTGGTVTAVALSGSIAVAGTQVGAGTATPTTCTISVDITTSATPTVGACPGTAANTNGSGQISGLSNLTNGVTNQCLTVTALTPTLTKAFSPTSISIGGTSTLTFTVSNPALNPAQTVSFTDTLPAGLRVASAPNVTNTCTGGTVTAVALSGSIAVAGTQVGAGTATPTTCTISVDITTSATPTVGACPGTAANTNGSGQISGLSNLTNGVTNQCLTVTALTPTLTKAFSPTSISIGGTSTLTFTVSNPALNPAQTVSFTDTLPAGLRVASAPNVTNTCTGGTVTAVALSGSIAVAGTQVGAGTATPTTCTISVDITTSATPTVGACPGTAANTNGSGQISGLSNLTNGVTNQCLTVTALTPTLTKAFSPTSISIGGTSTLTFTVSNPALNPAQTVSFTDTLPAGLRVASAPNVTNTCTGGTVTAVALSGSIAVAGTQVGAGTATPTTCTISVNITTSLTPTVGACPGTAANTNGSGQISGLSNLTNGVTNQCLTVTALTPTLTKAFSPTSISIGGTSTLTFTVSNPALNPAQTVSFTDTLPAGLRVASAPNVTNTCTGGTVTAVALSGSIAVAGTSWRRHSHADHLYHLGRHHHLGHADGRRLPRHSGQHQRFRPDQRSEQPHQRRDQPVFDRHCFRHECGD
ncbi:MAG: DUF11 domain-containing protein [Polaromonas sp.]|nr:DUF11 domain-containing protein [Polaromonas sp.]